MQTEAKASCLKRLGRIEGQVRGLSRMVEEDRYCIDIVTQVSAVRAALRRLEEEILRDHVGHCVEHAIAAGKKTDQRRKLAESVYVLGRAVRGRARPSRRPQLAFSLSRSFTSCAFSVFSSSRVCLQASTKPCPTVRAFSCSAVPLGVRLIRT